jgi:hypothetical protein
MVSFKDALLVGTILIVFGAVEWHWNSTLWSVAGIVVGCVLGILVTRRKYQALEKAVKVNRIAHDERLGSGVVEELRLADGEKKKGV